MSSPLAFIRRHLASVDVLNEVLFGLIMAAGFTGAARLGMEEADNRTLFLGILGCNLAWAIIDGAMYVMSELYLRGRRVRLVRGVLKAPSEEEKLRRIGEEIDHPLESVTTEADRAELHRWVLRLLPRTDTERARLRGEDLLGGLAIALTVLLATVPVLVPFLLFDDPTRAVRVAHGVATGMLFALGWRWGRRVGASGLLVGAIFALFALAMVGLTILLGG
jgi:hypothetical protein